jgi:hypothetical protein
MGFGDDRAVPLREMGLGEVLDAAIRLYRRHWKTFMAIVAVIIVPFTLLDGIFQRLVTHPFKVGGRVFISSADTGPLAAVTIAFAAASFLLITPLLTAAIVRAVGDSYMGVDPDVGRAFQTATARLWSVLLVVFLSGLAVTGGFLLLIIPGLIFYARFLFSSAVVVLEGGRGTEAMRRSWRLVKGRTGMVLLTVFLAGLLGGVVAGILSIPAGLVSQFWIEGWIVRVILVSLAQVVVTPFTTIVPVLLYFDMRIRKEGLDLAIMAQELNRAPGGP